MARYLAGVVSALLLVVAGFFVWRSLAQDGRAPVLPAAPAQAVAGPASGEPPQASDATREQKRFQRSDRDHDGTVTRAEYLASRRKAFDRLDANHDGTLQFDEYAAKSEAKFATADADRSGALDATEFATTKVERKWRPRCPPAQAAPRADEGEES